jgi:Tfp pilus assembly protein PilN
MIQFNLLPDVKLDYLKAQRTRRLAMTGATIATGAAIALLAIVYGYGTYQKQHLSSLSAKITAESNQLKNQPDIEKVLTVQNQLKSLTALHNAKPASSRLFGYLDQVTPATVSITNLGVDFTGQTITITGTADKISSVNQYVDTLKFAGYQVAGSDTITPAFSSVVLTSFSLSADTSAGGQPAAYTIDMAYNPAIFDNTQTVTLVVHNGVTTRSEIDAATVFQNAPAKAATPAPKAGN